MSLSRFFPFHYDKCAPSGVVRSKLAGVLLVLVVFLASVPAFSQANQGTIQGAVFDQTGGLIPGATVTVIDVARGISRPLTTDNAGQYIAVNVTPGTYTVRAEAKGFRVTEHSGVLVEVGQNVRVDLTLQPGEQTQTVTVTGELPSIDTTDSTLGGTVSNAAINALPLNGRNFERLLQLRPGVVTDPGSGAGNASTNGRRTGNDLLLVEGIAQIGPSNGTTTLNSVYRTGDANSLVPIDAIQEFNTQQNYKAEYGWRDGSVINVGVKSGTNSIHGAAYAFGRDASATDAHNFFTPGVATNATVEQFGAVAGGPIIKDKLFWFMGYEGLRTTLTNPVVDQIPADVAMPGFVPPPGSTNGCSKLVAGNCNFSMVDACNDLGAAKISALSAQLAGLNTATCSVSPQSPTFENLFPFTTNTNTAGNFTPNLITTGPLNNGFIKGDYVLGPHHHVSGFYFVSKSFQNVGYDNRQLLPQWQANVPSNVQMFNGAWTWTPNSTWVNDARAGYSYLYAKTLSADVNLLPSNPYPQGYGFNTGVTNPLYGGLPEIDVGGFQSYLGAGRRTGWRGPEGNVSFVDSVSYLRGKHAFKFGFDFVDVVYDNNAYNRANGQIKFSSLEKFLTGSPKSGTILVGDPNLYARAHWYAAFVQDDWRLTPRVTVNLGLRWEYNGSPVEQHNYDGSFNPNVNPATTYAVQQVGPGEPLTSFYNADYKDFSPRLGVAWDVRGNGKTVVRAGASILRNPVVAGQYIGLSPFGASVPSIGLNQSGTDANLHSPTQLALTGGQFTWTAAGPVFPGNTSVTINGVSYTGSSCTFIGEAGLLATPTPCTTQAVDPNFRQPYSAQWNLDIQRAITNSLTVDLAYVGVHGVHEATWVDINQPPVGAGWNTPTSTLPAALASRALPGGVSPAAYCLASATHPTPYDQCGTLGSNKQNGLVDNAIAANEAGSSPYYSKFPYLNEVVQLGNQDFSNYDGLQFTVNERTSHGLSFIAGYTFAHALDVVSADATDQQPYPINAYNVRLNYGNSDHDIRHRFTFSPTYLIPGKKSPGQMLEGWSISGIVTVQTGLPWTASDVTDDIIGTGEFVGTISSALQPWNYSGPTSAFRAGPQPISSLKGGAAFTTCQSAAEAPYSGNAQLIALADAALANYGCYAQGGGILTPPALGTIGNAGRNIFRAPNYYNVDMSIGKNWKFNERFSAQFRAEFFNLFNRADFALPGANNSGLDPGNGGQFGCACATADVQGNNPVLGSGGPRRIQFGLKLLF